ncbi:hypothetical protein PVL29_002337 [Vitis rotundifolia]|uniref:Uncharacterized protein n=1 Tax=Vitis rotundifolia TaxID=103349 RepID=A0AA39E2N3_VITRO|nr:hypothetical protein PVL29_002337 [Vitis rotundifolia]
MKKLRLLKVYNSHNSGDFDYASRNENYKRPFSQDFEFPSNKLMRYLYWHRYPLKSLPSNFHPKNLVELNLCCCYVEEIWKGVKHMEKLECINLSHSQYLVRTPDFSGIPNLERLIFEA